MRNQIAVKLNPTSATRPPEVGVAGSLVTGSSSRRDCTADRIESNMGLFGRLGRVDNMDTSGHWQLEGTLRYAVRGRDIMACVSRRRRGRITCHHTLRRSHLL